eukprot:8447695-Pyramimonas_sp.AAC.1
MRHRVGTFSSTAHEEPRSRGQVHSAISTRRRPFGGVPHHLDNVNRAASAQLRSCLEWPSHHWSIGNVRAGTIRGRRRHAKYIAVPSGHCQGHIFWAAMLSFAA